MMKSSVCTAHTKEDTLLVVGGPGTGFLPPHAIHSGGNVRRRPGSRERARQDEARGQSLSYANGGNFSELKIDGEAGLVLILWVDNGWGSV
jgi:hypothetical protein